MEDRGILQVLLDRQRELSRRIDDEHTPERVSRNAEIRLMEVKYILIVSGHYGEDS